MGKNGWGFDSASVMFFMKELVLRPGWISDSGGIKVTTGLHGGH